MMHKNITHSEEKSIKINPKLTQMLDVVTKDTKTVTIMHFIGSKVKYIRKVWKNRQNPGLNF